MAEDFCFLRITRTGLKLSEPRPWKGNEPDKVDDLFLLPSTWTYEEGLPTEARIPGFWDATVPIISATGTDTICSSLPQYKLGE